MNKLERIEARAFLLLNWQLEVCFDKFQALNSVLDSLDDEESEEYNAICSEVDEIAYEIAMTPQHLVRYVCETIGSQLHKSVEMTEEQERAGYEFIVQILYKDRSNWVKDFANGAAYGINPLGKFIRDQIHESVAVDPIFIDLRKAYQTFGMDLVLGVFDELLNQKVRRNEILSALNEYKNEFWDMLSQEDEVYEQYKCDIAEFDKMAEDLWEQGIVSGEDQSKEAKTGELAGGVGGAVVGAKVGAVIGSVVPGFGTIVGGAVGGALGNIFGKSAGANAGMQYKNQKKGKVT